MAGTRSARPEGRGRTKEFIKLRAGVDAGVRPWLRTRRVNCPSQALRRPLAQGRLQRDLISQNLFVNPCHSPFDNGVENRHERSAARRQAVLDLWRHNVELLSLYQPTFLQLLQFPAQHPGCYRLTQTALEQ